MRQRAIGEGELVLAACLCWGGARLAWPIPVAAALVGVAVSILTRHPKWLMVAAVLVATSLGSRAEQNYVLAPSEVIETSGRLVSDPRPSGPQSWRAEFRADDGRRLLIRASGPPAWVLADRTAGDQINIAGTQTPAPDFGWYKSRHLVGLVTPTTVVLTAGPPVWQQPAEWLRDGVGAGAGLLPEKGQPLYAGLVIGDDRFQAEGQRARFRAVGLAHLLAVSGQNVAFALAVAGPFLKRLGLHLAFAVTFCVLFWFAVATRGEPSVIRATITAAIAAWSVLRGARANGVRVLALTIIGALFLDPFLVHSVGFSLSALASAGIILGAEVVQSRLKGPEWFVTPLAVTLSAQLAVAPILIWVFGPISLASIGANVASGWAAGLVMAWGLSGGVLVNVLPISIGQVVQAPVGWLVWWIDWIAYWSWRLPFPSLGGLESVALASLVCGYWLFSRRVRFLRLPIFVAVLMLLATSVPRVPNAPVVLEGGGRFYPAGPASNSVLIVESRNDDRLVASVVEHRIVQVDYIVIVRGNRSTARVVTELGDLLGGTKLAPPNHVVVGAQRVLADFKLTTDAGVIHIEPADAELLVTP